MTTTNAESSSSSSSQLVVVDSVSGCLGSCNDWNLVDLQLKQLMHLYGVHVICTNGVSSSGEQAIGQVWNQVAEIQITTAIAAAADGVMQATLTSHPDLQGGGVSLTNFCITPKGLRTQEVVVDDGQEGGVR